jgi:NitT/TauT family transport system substrate-binding protein
MKKSTTSALIALSLGTLALTGCASGIAGATGLDEISVGVLPSIESAPLFLGAEEGFFEEEGLTLRIESFAASSSALVKPVIDGNYDVGVSDLLTLMGAHGSGGALRLIAPAGSTSGDTAVDFGALIVNGDSPLQNLTDLEGKVVGSNSLLDTNNTVLRSTMDAAGGDSSTVQWTQVAFQDAAAAITKGTVDATFIVEPYLSQAVSEGKRVLSHNYSEFHPELDVNAYFTSTAFAEDRPELLKRFTSALVRSIEFAQENPLKVRHIVPTYTETEWAVRYNVSLPVYVARFNKGAVNSLASAAVKYGVLKSEPDLSALLP